MMTVSHHFTFQHNNVNICCSSIICRNWSDETSEPQEATGMSISHCCNPIEAIWQRELSAPDEIHDWSYRLLLRGLIYNHCKTGTTGTVRVNHNVSMHLCSAVLLLWLCMCVIVRQCLRLCVDRSYMFVSVRGKASRCDVERKECVFIQRISCEIKHWGEA